MANTMMSVGKEQRRSNEKFVLQWNEHFQRVATICFSQTGSIQLVVFEISVHKITAHASTMNDLLGIIIPRTYIQNYTFLRGTEGEIVVE